MVEEDSGLLELLAGIGCLNWKPVTRKPVARTRSRVV